MNIRETSHVSDTGLIVTSLDEGDVTTLLPHYLLSQLMGHGYVVLRGFMSTMG